MESLDLNEIKQWKNEIMQTNVGTDTKHWHLERIL